MKKCILWPGTFEHCGIFKKITIIQINKGKNYFYEGFSFSVNTIYNRSLERLTILTGIAKIPGCTPADILLNTSTAMLTRRFAQSCLKKV